MKNLHRLSLLSVCLFLVWITFISCNRTPDNDNYDNTLYQTPQWSQLRKEFTDPPLYLKSRPLWFWNGPLSNAQTRRIMTASKEKGYYGLGILPSHGMSPEYMSPEFLEQYKFAVEMADSLGMKMCLYDEFYFPSGMAGGKLYEQYPEAVSKRLDKKEFVINGSESFLLPVPEGDFMGAVAVETNTLQRIDLSDFLKGEKLEGSLPEGKWNVMIFVLNPDNSSGRRHVDYLSPEAVNKFIELTYEKYYNAFPEHFGKTIDIAFYDEPTLRWVEGGRTWTSAYNRKFKEKYGFSPVIYYPALWYDIGPETNYARNLLFGFRAELYTTGFPKTINDWCAEHGILLTGHVDQEEVLNPVSTSGDLIKSFKYQDIPCVDQIAHYGRGSKIYKVISSAATNYNRRLVATECYGAMRNMPVENLYKEAMDQFAKGINLMEPHAVWYKDKADIPPNLSPSDEEYGNHLIAYNNYIGRLQCLLQHGTHKADIAILYPIASMQASYFFGNGDPGIGGNTSSETDYLDIGEMLSLDIRNDFAFIHPEILDSLCDVKIENLELKSPVENNQYKVIIIPGSRTIKLSNLEKIRKFYNQGGKVISTSRLPEFSTEKGRDNEVKTIIKEIFGENIYTSMGLATISASSIWNTGGFLPSYAADGDQKTTWRPSQKDPAGEWIEIDFGREIMPARIDIPGNQSIAHNFFNGWMEVDEDQSFSFSVMLFNGKEWTEAGSWKQKGMDKTVSFEPDGATKMRIVILSGKEDKVSIPEIRIFNEQNEIIPIQKKIYTQNSNKDGGKAYFIPFPESKILGEILDEAIPVWDFRIETDPDLFEGNLSYMHKKINNLDVYFIANSSDAPLELDVVLRGKKRIERWDPHIGSIQKLTTIKEGPDEYQTTRTTIKLGPVKSAFLVSK